MLDNLKIRWLFGAGETIDGTKLLIKHSAGKVSRFSGKGISFADTL